MYSFNPLYPAAALTELDTPTINKLLTALNECTEWGQVFILDSLANYVPKDEQEAQNICERVTPRLSHANAAVVLSAVKVTQCHNVPDSVGCVHKLPDTCSVGCVNASVVITKGQCLVVYLHTGCQGNTMFIQL